MFTLRTPRGIERVTINIANALAKRGHEVTLITGRCANSPTRAWIDPSVRIHEISHHRWHKLSFIPGFMLDFIRNDYDIVNLAIARGEGYAAGLAYLARKFRYNIIFHYPLEQHEKHFNAFKRFGTARHADEMIAVSRYIGQGVERWFRRPVKVVPNGVNREQFHPDFERRNVLRTKLNIPGDTPVLLTVSALQGRKGIGKVLNVVHILKKEFPQILYIVCGDGNEKDREAFLGKIAELQLESNVLFMGNQNEVAAYYNAADLFIFLPEFEGFGVVAIEAMASGMPIVVSQGSAFPEILENGGGLMVDPDAPASVAEAIRPLLHDAGRRMEMGSQGKASVEKNFSWDAIATQLEQIFKKQIEK